MAFFDRFRTVDESKVKEENVYIGQIDEEEVKKNRKHARKVRRNIWIFLGVLAAAAVVASPFLIGLAVTTAGAASAALTAAAVTTGFIGLGLGLGVLGSWLVSRPQRRRGHTAKRDDKGKYEKKADRSMTKSFSYDRAKNVTEQDMEKAAPANTKKYVRFVGIDKDIVDIWLAKPLSEDEIKFLKSHKKTAGFVEKFAKKEALTDEEKAALEDVQAKAKEKDETFNLDLVKRFSLNRDLTDDERIKLIVAMRTNDAAVKADFGKADRVYAYPYEYKTLVVKKGDDVLVNVDLEKSEVSTKSLTAHEILEQQQNELISQLDASGALRFYNGDPTVGKRNQKATFGKTLEDGTENTRGADLQKAIAGTFAAKREIDEQVKAAVAEAEAKKAEKEAKKAEKKAEKKNEPEEERVFGA